MEQIILIAHVIVAIAIIGLILMQQGKGADMGASFGAGASQTLFGSTGSGNVLTKGTALLATLFFATSFALAVVAKNKAVSAGDIDLPVPAAVEVDSTATPALNESDIPDMAPSSGQSEGSNSDIPQIDAVGSAVSEDIPE